MVKTIFFCRRRSDISHERYAELLLEGHVPIALRHHPTMRRYVVNVVEETLPGAPAVDSIGELWFDTLADFRERLYDSADGRRIVEHDVAGFMGGAEAYATTEHVHRRSPSRPARPTPGSKIVVGVRRSPALTHEEFVRHWHERHVPLVLEDTGVQAYVTNVVDGALGGSPPELDGVAELWFESSTALAAHLDLARDPASRIHADLDHFVGVAFGYRVCEYVER